jgi:hypothetical protein
MIRQTGAPAIAHTIWYLQTHCSRQSGNGAGSSTHPNKNHNETTMKMKPGKTALQSDRRKIQILIWIAGSVEFFITCLPGHTQTDIDAGIEHAVDRYLNRGETPGSAIPMGVQFTRHRIKQREVAANSHSLTLAFLAHLRRHDNPAQAGL